MKILSPRGLVTAAVIAALYAALTLLLAPISYGVVQFRLSEALTILPIFTPFAIPGLFIGCLLANLLGGLGIWDVFLGSLTTLIAAVCTYYVRKNVFLALLPPVVFNAVIIGMMIFFLSFTPPYDFSLAWPFVGSVGLGQLVSVCLAGGALYLALKKHREKIFG